MLFSYQTMKQFLFVSALLFTPLVQSNTLILKGFVGSGCTNEYSVVETSFTLGQGNNIVVGPWPNGQTVDSYQVVQFDGALGAYACQQDVPCVPDEIITIPNNPGACVDMPDKFKSDKILLNAGQLQ
ncbi:hypothetical protein F5884DRAFT_797570 [Xylogone sp. PMI_703]|nr:hypothetical protein F5884DRAFT_797570 [Xylogone sp. PMI_703]